MQLLERTQEELEVKRRMVEQIHKMDKQYACNMAKVSDNMDKTD